MTTHEPSAIRQRLAESLADSVVAPFPRSTPRVVHGRVAFPGKATAVIGFRRSGKTTLLHQVRGERVAVHGDRARVPYLNLEDERLAGVTLDDLGFAVDEHYRRFPGLLGHDVVTWCLDEIQVVPGWERFVRRLLDTGRVEVFLSGSSAALLSAEIATSMRGRGWTVTLFPFSFEEALRHAGEEVPSAPGAVDSGARVRVEHAFSRYLAEGGFPEAQGQDAATRHRLLLDYVDVAMMRDVVERHRVTNVTGLRWLVRQLLGNAGGAFSVERFYGALRSQGIAISKDSLHELLHHLEDCFLLRTTWLDTASERQRMVNPRKAHPVDPGLIPVFDRVGRANSGHALETAVRIELERRGASVAYVRTPEGHEVDFVARYPGGGEELIQVTADATAPETAEREVRALSEAAPAYPRATCRLLTLTTSGLPARVPANVVAETAWAWMLTRPDALA
jgi:predicted AAA+ superfamily ATPase